MKKLCLMTLVYLGFANTIQAQDISDNAIGIRLGAIDGVVAEISYQRALGEINRIELDLGWRKSEDVLEGSLIKFTGVYQWVLNINDRFNWYAGVGGGFTNEEPLVFGTGDIGIEYNFNFPIQLSLDLRPELGLYVDNTDSILNLDLGFGLRYIF